MDEQRKRDFDTLSEANNAYVEEGYVESFDTRNGKIVALSSKKEYNPEDLVCVADFRFEGMTNPGDNMILMIIEANDGAKGTLVDNMGGADTAQDPDLIRAIPMRTEQTEG